MKKTISVNLKGMNFLVEEDAYELLQDYLDRLETALGGQVGTKEILEDVEIRIAELCDAKLTETKTVIEVADIESILETLGNPEDYVEADEDDESSSNADNGHQSRSYSEKRLYRDDENGAIAGVCAGIANYFNMDVVLIRIIFVVILLFGGFGLPLYIVLWIVIPKAKNTIDRLRMKGRPVTVENVKNEVEIAAEKIKDGSKQFARKVKRDIRRDDYGRRVSTGARILASIVGIILIGMGIVQLIGFLIVVIGGLQFFPVQSDTGFLSFAELGELVLSDASDYSWAWAGGVTLALSVILFLFLLGSMLIFRLRNRWSKLSLLGLFLTGLTGFFMCFYVAMSTARDFAMDGEIERTVGEVQTEQLLIIPQLDPLEDMDGFNIKSKGNWGLMTLEGDNIKEHGIRFKYVRSSDSLFHIKQTFSARSHSHETALNKSKNIHHSIALQGDSLLLDTEYTFPKADKLRDQDVVIIIEIPENGQVKVKDRIIRLGADQFDEDIISPYYDESGYLRGNGCYRHWD